MAKTDVNGAGADPAIKYLRDYSSMNGGDIGWNFSKFLVNKDGDVVASYGPPRSPASLADDIKTVLAMG